MAPEWDTGQVIRPVPSRQTVYPNLMNGGTSGAETRWTNLGFWAPGDDYPAAARELARRVGQAAALRPGDVVIDYACGHGDSLALWVREFGVGRVIGVEADPEAAAAAERRVQEWGLSDRIRVHTGSAESFLPARESPLATAVVAVDAAYHFADRATWLRRLSSSLAAGTRLGFSDITLSPGVRWSASVRAMARRAAIPEANLWTTAEVASACAAAGITVVDLEQCGREVLGGFARHAVRSAPRWALHPALGGFRALGTAAAILLLRRRERLGERLGYLIVAGRTATAG